MSNAAQLEAEEETASMRERPLPVEPPFQQLFVSVPVGLALQFLPETCVGIPFDAVRGEHKVSSFRFVENMETIVRHDQKNHLHIAVFCSVDVFVRFNLFRSCRIKHFIP